MEGFHHPHLSWPIARRRTADLLLYLLAEVGVGISTGGRGMVARYWYPEANAARQALYRLRRAGLLVMTPRGTDGRARAGVDLTDLGQRALPDTLRPQRYWNQAWKKRWYCLSYDVPESMRPYRETLRSFLVRMRMGQLQRSVYVTPRDIRPEFDDLRSAAQLGFYAMLFESRTVHGTPDAEVVRRAWDMGAVATAQGRHLEFCGTVRELAGSGELNAKRAAQLLRAEMEGYLDCMERDPLLPRTLWPPIYFGEQVYAVHRETQRLLTSLLER